MCVIRVVINRVFSLSVTKETDPRGKTALSRKEQKCESIQFGVSLVTHYQKKEETLLLQSK